MKDIPFSVYDFFGYLAPGFLILVILGFWPVTGKFLQERFYHIPQLQHTSDTPEVQQKSESASLPAQAWRNYSQLTRVLENNFKLQETLLKSDTTNTSQLLEALKNNLDMQRALHTNLLFLEAQPKHFLFRKDIGFVFFVLWVGVAYVLGHILAILSAWLLERMVTKKWLRSPSINLFWSRPKKGFLMRSFNFIFEHYWEPLVEPLRRHILDALAKDKIIEERWIAEGWLPWGEPKIFGEINRETENISRAMYLHAYSKVKKEKWVREQLNTFLNLYGFSRNMSLSFILAGVIVLCCSNLVFLGLACVLVSILMFFCYLKFFRLWYRELFLAYGELQTRAFEVEPEGGGEIHHGEVS
ncbi:MAG: hypothetical protein JSV84_06765 [Gemmatimonadota bacterium]|nr:MAG: hypothetical protein JSV84_06765 [Gemmatimonadota bacterium]